MCRVLRLLSAKGVSCTRKALVSLDKHTGEKVTPTHLFRIASVSKPITSVAIFLLLEQNRLTAESQVMSTGCPIPE
jgi:hypothetical protein